MTARVSPGAVKEIVSTTLSDDVLSINHIDTANTYVNEVLEGGSLSEAMLTKIELYLAAHFVALSSEGAGITRSKLGDADESYANVYGQGLNSTRFGQAAVALDSTGALAAAAQTTLKANFRVI
jgi:hypothetical protein